MPSVENLTAELAQARAERDLAQMQCEQLRTDMRHAAEKFKEARDILREQVRAIHESLE